MPTKLFNFGLSLNYLESVLTFYFVLLKNNENIVTDQIQKIYI